MTTNRLYDPWREGARIKAIVGHYGSGKTEIALNMALSARAKGMDAALCDLDVVNPFFRSAEQWRMLEDAGVRGIFPPYALTGVDVPVLPAEVRSVFGKPGLMTVLDVGGDDAGAAALGQYKPCFDAEPCDLLYVVNPYRPFSENAAQILDMMERISRRARMRPCGIINNANLARETTADTVLSTRELLRDISRETGLPVIALAAEERLAATLPPVEEPVYPIRRFLVPEWMDEA